MILSTDICLENAKDVVCRSPHMFTNHLLTNTIKSLKELGGGGGRDGDS